MVGAVIITHAKIGEAVIKAMESIAGGIEKVKTVSVEGPDALEEVRSKLVEAVREVDSGAGVIIFTDMFGGTPTNIALSVLEEDRVEILTGVNLPVMLKFENYKREKTLTDLAHYLKDYGQKSIVLAGDVLKEKKD